MPLRGKIKNNHIPLNSFELIVAGLPQITVVTTDDIEQMITAVTMPDGTIRSGGKTEPVEFTLSVPMHHDVEQAAMEAWKKLAEGPVRPTYLKAASLIFYRNDGTPKSYTFSNMWLSGRTIPGADMGNEGEMAAVSFAVKADYVSPV
jgi:hypothetical protein